MKEIVAFLLTELRGAMRFKWSALLVAFVVFAAGAFAVLTMPDVYEARARVFVDTSSRLRDVLGRIAFEPDVDSRVALVRQAMLGRPQLERVANETDLDLRATSPEAFNELIDSLLVKINVSSSRQEPNLYTITYQDRDRETALAVVDKLLNTFVEDVIDQKEQGSRAAETFLSDQIRRYADQLAEEERRLAEFKKKNVGLMPGDSGDYFSRLQRETEAAEQLQASLEIARSRRGELQRQLAGESPLLPEGEQLTSAPAGSAAIQDPTTLRIRELESTLSELLLRFTDRHPDVVAIREQLTQLRAQREQELAALAAGAQSDSSLATNPVFQNLRLALNEADVQIAALQGELRERNRRIGELRALLDTAPEVEAELARLTRNYGNTRALYDQLLTQLEQERLVNEGDAQNVINFQTIDPPQAAFVPVGPPRGIFLLGAFLFALGLGAAAAFVRNRIKPVFFDSTSLRNASGLPVLGEVSATTRDRTGVSRLDTWGYAAASCLWLLTFIAVFSTRQSTSLALQRLIETVSAG